MKGKRVSLTDKQVEKEIERLSGSEAVALARQEKRVKYKRRQYLYQLRWLEKRGKELQEQGVTKEDLRCLRTKQSQSMMKVRIRERKNHEEKSFNNFSSNSYGSIYFDGMFRSG